MLNAYCVSGTVLNTLCVLKNVILFIYLRARETEWEGQRERETPADSMLTIEPGVELDLTI